MVMKKLFFGATNFYFNAKFDILNFYGCSWWEVDSRARSDLISESIRFVNECVSSCWMRFSYRDKWKCFSCHQLRDFLNLAAQRRDERLDADVSPSDVHAEPVIPLTSSTIRLMQFPLILRYIFCFGSSKWEWVWDSVKSTWESIKQHNRMSAVSFFSRWSRKWNCQTRFILPE